MIARKSSLLILIRASVFSLLSLLSLNACTAVQEEAMWAPLKELVGHPKPIVSVPSTVGALAGGVVGVPVAIGALPVTALLGGVMDANLLPLTPIALLAELGAITTGGPMWLLFGWWGTGEPETGETGETGEAGEGQRSSTSFSPARGG